MGVATMERMNLGTGKDYCIEENSVDVYVRHLRAKFGDGVVKTVRGMGYIMPEAGA